MQWLILELFVSCDLCITLHKTYLKVPYSSLLNLFTLKALHEFASHKLATYHKLYF